jgi:hypothetical protein
MKVVVYTSITGNRDSLIEQPLFDGVGYVAFLDREDSSSAGWEVRRASDLFLDPCRNAKAPKVLAHQYLPEADISLWVDGNIRLKAPISALIDECLQTTDIAVFQHHERDCIYDEADYCISANLDASGVIRHQMSRYLAAGYPRHNGLVMAGVLLRRHTPQMEALENAWWAEICRGSRRDQLSFNYVAHRLSTKYGIIPGRLVAPGTDCPGQYDNAYFSLRPHAGQIL